MVRQTTIHTCINQVSSHASSSIFHWPDRFQAALCSPSAPSTTASAIRCSAAASFAFINSGAPGRNCKGAINNVVAHPKAAPLSWMLRVQLRGLGRPAVLRGKRSLATNATVGVRIDVIPAMGSAPLAAPPPLYQVKPIEILARRSVLPC